MYLMFRMRRRVFNGEEVHVFISCEDDFLKMCFIHDNAYISIDFCISFLVVFVLFCFFVGCY